MTTFAIRYVSYFLYGEGSQSRSSQQNALSSLHPFRLDFFLSVLCVLFISLFAWFDPQHSRAMTDCGVIYIIELSRMTE